MTDELREELNSGDYAVLEYFSRDHLRQRLIQDGNTNTMVTRVMNGLHHKSVREIAELPNTELDRKGWTGSTVYKVVGKAILGLLTDGWS